MRREEYQKMYSVEDSHWWFSAKRLYAGELLKLTNCRFAKILDVGCGTGRNLLMLRKYGQVYGVDINPLALKFCAQRGLNLVKRGGAEKLPYRSEFFDLVTIFDVLYHRGLKSDAQALSEAFRVLKKDGYLLVNDCAYQWLYGPHDIAMYARQRYSRPELKKKIAAAGFKIKRASYTNMLVFPLFLLNRFLKKINNFSYGSDVDPLPLWFNRMLISVSRAETGLLQRFDLPYGSSIMILAQKPTS